ncbi:hypothetical protein [Clostridium estertheticum]|uniref:Uncharacterized protein n=1 Tax=Clostridium estertheticum TaxID=238834 RepID=A0A5N7IV21_9CLOT|nr:hypothetical protein [Clostridium estertheticum]MBZ9618469.1 hypothetical protein [Clostridium estertheticum subsp. laramiense]MCB2342472.1 hypothetical protein [Clostridium estertheticum]MPQ34154.1 hypothetical protein [Clostridium estertheticum]MPQ64756.1 hypothetical protein [Clostridium estertheticum]WAG76295.1 hypothetical protein LL032_22875 [Clostridium estertheticum]
MKKNKITKHLIGFITYVIEYGIAFSITENVTNFWGIRYKTFFSLEFALYIIIVTIISTMFEFLVSKIKDIRSKGRSKDE